VPQVNPQISTPLAFEGPSFSPSLSFLLFVWVLFKLGKTLISKDEHIFTKCLEFIFKVQKTPQSSATLKPLLVCDMLSGMNWRSGEIGEGSLEGGWQEGILGIVTVEHGSTRHKNVFQM